VHYVPAPIAESLLLMTAMIFTGLGLAWIYERRGTIVAPIAAHVTFNAVVITVIFASR
jgi:membrane protease YdiL (CAAX protease family)